VRTERRSGDRCFGAACCERGALRFEADRSTPQRKGRDPAACCNPKTCIFFPMFSHLVPICWSSERSGTSSTCRPPATRDSTSSRAVQPLWVCFRLCLDMFCGFSSALDYLLATALCTCVVLICPLIQRLGVPRKHSRRLYVPV